MTDLLKELENVSKIYEEKVKKQFLKDKSPFKFNPKELGDYDSSEKCILLEKHFNNRAIRNEMWDLLRKSEQESNLKLFQLMFGTNIPEE